MNEKRNWKIYFTWIDGCEYNELAKEFGLSHDTIKNICHSLLPEKVKQSSWQRQNAYKAYRDWYKKVKADQRA